MDNAIQLIGIKSLELRINFEISLWELTWGKCRN